MIYIPPLIQIAGKPKGYIRSSGYVYVEDLDMDLLHTLYAEHRRLRVFHHKGCACAMPGCELVGTRLIRGRQIKCAQNVHTDLYAEHPITKELILMTIDHIHPKSQGGSNHLDNLQPMCIPHNGEKNSLPMKAFIKE